MMGDEFGEFVADIKANGLREKITLYEGKISRVAIGIAPVARPTSRWRLMTSRATRRAHAPS